MHSSHDFPSQVKVMEIFDVTQTDPSLLVSDSMGIQYSMDDQVSSNFFCVFSKYFFARFCQMTAYLVCATPPALPRSPQSLVATLSRALASPPHPGTSPKPPPSFKRCPKRQNGQLLQAFASRQKSCLRYLDGLLVSYNTSDLHKRLNMSH